jgi:hypothetical protein
MWYVTNTEGHAITLKWLMRQHGKLYAADEDGFEVDVEEMHREPERVADAGFGERSSRHITFWASEADSKDRERKVAEGVWKE